MMTQLTPTETHSIKEIARAHAVAIEKLALYERLARDGELRHLFAHAARKMRQHYEELRSFGETGDGMGGFGTAGYGAQGGAGWDTRQGASYGGFGQTGQDAQWTRAGTWAGAGSAEHPQPKAPWTPSSDASMLSDRVMCTDLLECCKHMAMVCTMAALEASHGPARRTFKQLAMEHIDLAFDVYHYMEKNGWYGTRSASAQQIQQIAQSYQPVQGSAWGGTSSTVGAGTYGTSGAGAGAAMNAGQAGSGWQATSREQR